MKQDILDRMITSGICLVIFLFSVGLNPATVFGDQGHGNDDLHFWFPLSEFEVQSLAMVDEARRGDPETLLRISLMAAGIRDERRYRSYLGKIKAFLDKTGPELGRIGNNKERGRLLHERMHHHFLLPASRNNRPYGYDLDQSSIATLLDTGKFNCTSSALLYLILARYFDLEARGAVVPNHVFVELKTKKGRFDIETTNSNGFGKIHDRRFYQQQARDWASWRGLQPVTYQDYLDRRFISPLELVAMNMDDQHVRTGTIKEDDRLRLKEAQSLIMADDINKQIQRLGLYNNEYNRLSGRNEYATLVEKFKRIEPILDDIARRWPYDRSVAEMLSWLYYQQASSVFRAGDLTRVFPLMKRSLDLHSRSAKDDDRRVRDNNLALLALIIKGFLADGLFSEALGVCDNFAEEFREEVHFIDLYRSVYSGWGGYYWQRKEWSRALEIFNEELVLVPPVDDAESARLRDRMADCYLNRGASALQEDLWQQAVDLYIEGLYWSAVNAPSRSGEFRRNIALSYQMRAISYFNESDWSAAAKGFANSMEWTDDPAMRSSVKQNLQAVFNNWKNEYLQSGDLIGAKGVLENCIERFPAIELCREQLRGLESVHPL